MPTIKFGGKLTMRDKAATVQNRLGKTTGASKGSKPAPKGKIAPKASTKNGGTVGLHGYANETEVSAYVQAPTMRNKTTNSGFQPTTSTNWKLVVEVW